MDTQPKPKSNALLKNLPEERQEQIYGWCNKANDVDAEGDPIAGTGGLAFAQAQLAEDGIKVSLTTLSEFARWYALRLTFQRAETQAQEVERMLRSEFPQATPEKIALAGQLVFTMQASNAGDAKTFVALEQLRLSKTIAENVDKVQRAKLEQKDRQILQKDRDLSLAERRVKLLEENAAKAKQTLEAVKKAGGLSAETLAQIEEAARLL